MTATISFDLIAQLEKHLEAAYPEEGAGFLLGSIADDETRQFTQLILLGNHWEEGPRTDRYLISAKDVMAAEDKAEKDGVTLLGVFHSHPDAISRPSEFDRTWALPWFSYIITTVAQGKASNHRLWQLSEDRRTFIEEELLQNASEYERQQKT